MNPLESQYIHCPYCGEPGEVLIDCSVSEQQYIEDCQVCCRPIVFQVNIDADGAISLMVTNEND